MENSTSAIASLTLVVNGEAVTTAARTLAELVQEAGHATSKVATAVNGQFVAERRRTDTVLRDRDRIEIVSPRQGG